MTNTRDTIDNILRDANVIVVVGHSDKPHRTSYRIADYLRQQGFTVYPVNPTVSEIDGQPSYARLSDVPEPIDIVNVFRRSEHLLSIVEEALELGVGAIWSQLNVLDEKAYALAQSAGVPMVMDHCIMVEHRARR